MFRNYVKIALRNILKSKIYSLINIFGLAVGMAACIAIFLFIREEKSFDGFHSKKNQIYRLNEIQNFSGTHPQKVALSMPAMGPHMLNDFPEIIKYTRYWGRSKRVYELGEKKLVVDQSAIVDSTFLEIFDFNMLQGNPQNALDEPNSLIVSLDMAKRFFGTDQVLGESLIYSDIPLKITGVMENVPDNSHLQFEALISMSTVTSRDSTFNNRWGSNYVVTYFLLQKDTDIELLESKFPAFMANNMGEEINESYTLFLQPLEEVHLDSRDVEHDYQNYRKFDQAYLDVFTILAIFVIVIASINFMNLSTAQSVARSREVALRKSIGAHKKQLISQFLGESIVMSLIALLMALLFAAALLPYLNQISNRTLSLTGLLEVPGVILIMLAISIMVGVISGIYPAFIASSFKPALAIKGQSQKLSHKSLLRNGLVVLQFSIAIILVAGTLLTLKQLEFMRNKDLGFNKDQMLLVPMSGESNEKYRLLYNELKQLPGVIGVTATGQRLGNNLHQWSSKATDENEPISITISQINVDRDFLDVYNIELIQGRNFNPESDHEMSGGAFIINESLARELGFENPTDGKLGFSFQDSLSSVIGVVKDFHYNSLHFKVNTLGIYVRPQWGYSELSIKLKSDRVGETVQAVSDTWEKLISDRPIEYSFLDQHFEELYHSDSQVTEVVQLVAVLTIIIACLGLFGLASITTEHRIKEIGIRKVLGASIPGLLLMLNRNVIALIFISIVVATPISYWAMNLWLENFAFRIDIHWSIFALSGILAITIALLTVVYHSLRATLSNPVNSLRYE